MSLCKLCQTIPFADIPALPSDAYWASLSGRPYIHKIALAKLDGQHPDPLGFRHHPDLASLRRAASDEGCALCKLIAAQIDLVLEDYAGLDEQQKEYEKPPRWDLWLTRRMGTGEGFWVVSPTETREGRRRQMLSIVAAFGYCVDDDGPLADAIRGRVIEEKPGPRTLERIVGWIKESDQIHMSIEQPVLPSRLIDVSGEDIDVIWVTKPDQEGDSDRRYIALSYRHEDDYRFSEAGPPGEKLPQTSRIAQTYQAQPWSIARGHQIEVSGLAQTYQDAIAFTRTAGIKYLWIDDLCIPVDEAAGWRRDSPEAVAVFTNAYLTLAATAAKNRSDGLFQARQPREYLRLPYVRENEPDGEVMLYTLPVAKEVVKDYYTEMRSEPLSEDVWAFSERLLSRRSLHFASDQIYFESPEGFWGEDGLQMSHRMPNIYIESIPESFWGPQAGSLAMRGDGLKAKALTIWYNVLWKYGRIKPAKPSDKLPAIAGVARALGKYMGDDEYLAGMWRSTLSEGLCWQGLKCTAVDEYRAPSWSWASIDAIPGIGLRDNRYEAVAKISDCRVDPVDGEPDSFGRVRGGWIKMEAPLIPLVVCERKSPYISVRTVGSDEEKGATPAGFDVIERKYDESAEMLAGMKLYALVVTVGFTDPESCTTGGCRTSPELYTSLIVTPVDGDEARFKRLGFILQQGTEWFGSGELESSRRAITLV